MSLEDDVDIIYAVNNFVDEEKAKKVLNSLMSISLAKGYYYCFGFGHFRYYCWRCLQNEYFQILIKRRTNKVILMGSYDILNKRRRSLPFLWIVENKKQLVIFYVIILYEVTVFSLNFWFIKNIYPISWFYLIVLWW